MSRPSAGEASVTRRPGGRCAIKHCGTCRNWGALPSAYQRFDELSEERRPSQDMDVGLRGSEAEQWEEEVGGAHWIPTGSQVYQQPGGMEQLLPAICCSQGGGGWAAPNELHFTLRRQPLEVRGRGSEGGGVQGRSCRWRTAEHFITPEMVA
ncbi:hypothetical protein SKAU_G00304160 [Synaphobranchus kaupii]|uniref:Uncharacterized protein n=1 Tax=Synaphobranchus kaupii TaxID=118154 RepID=A0A9Q1EWB3_SYNKA|nr:hypothetical protein SKAU_G00304160 [Synaphobranchus kaupii]